ncbi:MAG TPA: protoporphyrinogen oxidase [Chthoniobacteraceae bacterium]|jgi:oxygen-dependent protoporphyrinogen oxidase|nr:protoporphyrinogen oxidase [Chthoniobacteraceae bacterium]
MNTIAIIGGGITGLTAAFRLRQRGIGVTVYEAGQHLGGVIRTVQRDGYTVECGPGSILETSPKIAELVHDLGLDARRHYSSNTSARNFILRGGRLIAVPKTPVEFLTTRLFSPLAKLRAGCEPLISRSSGTMEENVASFVKRRLGGEFLKYAIDPFVSGIYAGDPARLSVRHAFPKLAEVEKRYGSLFLGQFLGKRERNRRAEKSAQKARKFSFDQGLGVLTQGLAERLGDSIRTRAKVMALRRSGSSWIVQTDGYDEPMEHSAVILAAPAHKLAQIDLDCRTEYSLAPLSGIYHPPVATVALGFRREDVGNALDGFGFLVPRSEHLQILGATFSSSIYEGRAPAGNVLVTTFLGGCRNPESALNEPGKLIDMAMSDLRKVLAIKGSETFAYCTCYQRAIPQYEIGYGRYKLLMKNIEQHLPGLFFAGSYRDGISLGNSIVSGYGAADRGGRYFRAGGLPVTSAA